MAYSKNKIAKISIVILMLLSLFLSIKYYKVTDEFESFIEIDEEFGLLGFFFGACISSATMYSNEWPTSAAQKATEDLCVFDYHHLMFCTIQKKVAACFG